MDEAGHQDTSKAYSRCIAGSRLLLLEKFVFLVLGFDAEKNGEVGTKGGVVGLVSFSTVNGFPRLGYFRLGLLLDESSILC